MFVFLTVGYPLTVIGGIFGKNWANGFDAPCRTKNIPREIPIVPWYRSGFAHCMVGGFLPFRYGVLHLSFRVRKHAICISTMSDTNQIVQPQKIV